MIKETEENLLGYVLRTGDPTTLFSLQGKFYHENHEKIANVMLSLYKAGTKIDLLSVGTELERHDKNSEFSDLAHLLNNSVIADPEYSIKEIQEAWKRRMIGRLISEVEKKIDLEDPQTLLSSLANDCISLSIDSNKKSTIHAAFEEMEEEMGKSLEARQAGRKTIGIPVGYKLDGMVDGLRPAHLWVIAAYTSTGKTTFSVNMARHLLEGGNRVVMYSLETSKTDLLSKFVALDTWIPTRDVLHSAEKNSDYEKYQKSRDMMKEKYRLTIHDDKHDIDDIALSMRQESAKEHVDAFFLDYIQNITSKTISEEYNLLTRAMSTLKLTLKATNSPLVMFSQISNDDSRAKSALLMNGKGSGSIKSASTMFAYMKPVGEEKEILQYYTTGEDVPFDLIVNKNQNGMIGVIHMKRKQLTGEIYETR